MFFFYSELPDTAYVCVCFINNSQRKNKENVKLNVAHKGNGYVHDRAFINVHNVNVIPSLLGDMRCGGAYLNTNEYNLYIFVVLHARVLSVFVRFMPPENSSCLILNPIYCTFLYIKLLLFYEMRTNPCRHTHTHR